MQQLHQPSGLASSRKRSSVQVVTLSDDENEVIDAVGARRAMRRAYIDEFEALTELQESKKNYTPKGYFLEVDSHRERLEELSSQVRLHQDASRDAKTFLKAAEVANEAVEMTMRDSARSVNVFANCVRSFCAGSQTYVAFVSLFMEDRLNNLTNYVVMRPLVAAAQTLVRSDDDSVEEVNSNLGHIDWAVLGDFFAKRARTINFDMKTINFDVEVVAKKKRKRAEQEKIAPAIVVKAEPHGDQDNVRTQDMDVEVLFRQIKQGRYRSMIEILATSPSYSKMIENVSALSHLVREELIEIKEDGSFVDRSASRGEVSQLHREAVIMKIDMNIYKQACIKYAKIKQSQHFGSQAAQQQPASQLTPTTQVPGSATQEYTSQPLSQIPPSSQQRKKPMFINPTKPTKQAAAAQSPQKR